MGLATSNWVAAQNRRVNPVSCAVRYSVGVLAARANSQGIVATIALVAYNFGGVGRLPFGDLRTRARCVARRKLLERHDPSFGTERPQGIRPHHRGTRQRSR